MLTLRPHCPYGRCAKKGESNVERGAGPEQKAETTRPREEEVPDQQVLQIVAPRTAAGDSKRF